MPGVPNPFDISYGEYDFSEMAETVSLTGRMVYDSAGRTVTHVVYSITIKDIIQNDDGTEEDMTSLRTQLETPAQVFIYANTGFGDLRINTEQDDMMWGPKPQILSCKPKGGGNAWEITWTVELAICECGHACQFGRPMEFNYTLATSVDRAGLSRRTYSGYLRIPQTRATPATRTLNDNADKYLEQVIPPLIPGFRRIPGDHSIDESKCKLTFSVVDEELPSTESPPPFCITASFSHTVKTNAITNLKWQGTMHGRYELVKGKSPTQALVYFQRAVASRRDIINKVAQGQSMIPREMTITEPDAYGPNVVDISLSYTVVTKLPDLIRATGLFTPMPEQDANWQEWANSLKVTAWHPRGLARLTFKNSDDAIWDICAPEAALPTAPGKVIVELIRRENPDLFKKPTAAQSWIDFKNSIKLIEIPPTVTHVLLSANIIAPTQAPVNALTQAVTGYNPAWNGAQRSQIVQQVRTVPRYNVSMKGMALRAGFQITAPRVVSFGGQAATPIVNNKPDSGFVSGLAGNWDGVPIYGARWHLLYELAGEPAPNTVIAPPNTLFSTGTV